MSKVLRGAESAPVGYGAAPGSKQYVSKMTHGFFITINSMILYLKHIIHIDDFPLNGHPTLDSFLLGPFLRMTRVEFSDGLNSCNFVFAHNITSSYRS